MEVAILTWRQGIGQLHLPRTFALTPNNRGLAIRMQGHPVMSAA